MTTSSFLNTHLLNHLDVATEPLFHAYPFVPPTALNDTATDGVASLNSSQSLRIRRADTSLAKEVLWRDEKAAREMRSSFPWLPPLLPDGNIVDGFDVEKGMDVALTVKEGWWGKKNNDRLGVDEREGRDREWGAVKVRRCSPWPSACSRTDH